MTGDLALTRGVGRALAAGTVGAMVAAAWLALFYALHPVLKVEFDTDPPRLVNGAYPAERDPATGLTFAWTRQEFALRLPAIDRRVDWVLTVTVRGARPDPRENPDLGFYADGVLLVTRRAETDFRDVAVTIPADVARRRGALITMRTSRTFVPGPSDRRALGVMLDRVTLAPAGIVLAPPSALGGAAIAGAALGAAVALLGITAGSAVGAAVLLGVGEASVVSRGFGPFSNFPALAATLALWIGAGLCLVAGAVRYWRGQPLRNTAKFAAAFTAGVLYLRVLVLLHPDMPIGDTLFQAHRFQDVLGGRLFFTSIAPGNYQFPYAPGLYVFASLFAPLVRRGLADMALLRIVVCATDAVAALLLYRVVVGARRDRLAAAMAVAIYQLIPLGFGVVRGGNLTNAFAQSLAVMAVAALAAGWLEWRRWTAILLSAAIMAAAFMSHTSTFAILSVTAFFVTVSFLWRGGRALRSPGWAVAAALVLAVIVSVALYYAHFMDTYRTQLTRIGAETASAAPDAGGRSITERLADVPRYVGLYFGWAAPALALWGGWQLWRDGARDRLTLTLAAWALSCFAFLLVGVLTPVDMRYYLAAIPAVAIAAATGASSGWASHGTARLVAAALLAWCIVTGVHNWWSVLS